MVIVANEFSDNRLKRFFLSKEAYLYALDAT